MKKLVLLIIILILGVGVFVKPEVALGREKTGAAVVDMCGTAKGLIDKVAVAILNESPLEAFDKVLNEVMNEICAVRKSVEPDPMLMQLTQDLGVAVLGWAWDVSTLMKFKMLRNPEAVGIAEKDVKRRVAALKLLCPTLVVPDVTGIP
jgi:hypothetical protein